MPTPNETSTAPAIAPQADKLQSFLDEHLDAPVQVYADSVQQKSGAVYLLARPAAPDDTVGAQKLVVLTEAGSVPFAHEAALDHPSGKAFVCPPSPGNARHLREVFPWTTPVPLNKTSAIGCGDRLGLASPGHIRACQNARVRPVLAQQSIREMTRTGRSPQEVMDDAMWAAFQEGYEDGFGADADHLKDEEAIDACLETGYTMYTIDPSDHVDNDADHLETGALAERYAALPWDALDTTPEDNLQRYTAKAFELDSEDGPLRIDFDEEALKRAAVKYSAALAHTKKLADYLAQRYEEARPGETYDLEMSVDETDHPTRPREHLFVAAELERMGVDVTSLAPRFVGDFQKGIDFIGDLDEFEEAFEKHATISESFGDYKISIHSGSDKFSVFPIMGRHAGDHLHLKTAGTSYLEALRIPARHNPELFRDIVDYAFERFEADTKSYHVTTDLSVVPDPQDVADDELENVYLEEDNGRQLLHITYGSVLTAEENDQLRFKDRFLALLDAHEEEHYAVLQEHFLRHIESIGTLTRRKT